MKLCSFSCSERALSSVKICSDGFFCSDDGAAVGQEGSLASDNKYWYVPQPVSVLRALSVS